MNKSLLLGIAVLSLLVTSCAEAEIFKPIFNKTFSEKVIDSILTAESEKVITTKKEVVILDSSGNIKTSHSLKENQFALLFKNGDGFAIITTKPQSKQIIEKIELFSREDKPLCSVTTKGPPFISPDGRWFFTADNFKNQISFYDNSGKLLGEHNFADIRNLTSVFTDDSQYCLINIPNIQKGKTSGFLVLFDSNGKKLWQFDHKGSTTGQVAISKDATNIIYSSENELFSLNRKGKVNYKIPLLPGGLAISISPNGKFIAVARREDNSVSLYEGASDKLIWEKKLQGLLGYNSPFTSIDVNDKGYILAAVAKSWSTKNDISYLYLLKDSENLKSTSFSQRAIKAKFTDNGNNILVLLDKVVILYALD